MSTPVSSSSAISVDETEDCAEMDNGAEGSANPSNELALEQISHSDVAESEELLEPASSEPVLDSLSETASPDQDATVDSASPASEEDVLAPEVEETDLDDAAEVSPDATSSNTSTPAPVASKQSTSTSAPPVRTLADDTRHIVTEAKDVIEYEWPMKSGEKWFLQEQIGELLDIKSFSRKYTDLTRRKVEKEERDFLFANYDITNLMTETQIRDLCAIRSIEIHDLMSTEYPLIYQDYQKILAERYKATLAEQAREMQAIKNDAKLMAELRATCMKNTAEFNRELQNVRRNGRGGFWDIQTNVIQIRATQFKRLTPEQTKVGLYPVGVMSGQFQHHYRVIPPEELRRLPLATVMTPNNLFEGQFRDASPPPMSIVDRGDRNGNGNGKTLSNGHTPFHSNAKRPASSEENERSSTPAKRSKSRKCTFDEEDELSESKLRCHTCQGGPIAGQKMLQCASCKTFLHTQCLEMSDEMIAVVFTYPWNCIDCKRCTICNDVHSEEKIVFCDRCDRGFHTFCVGLDDTPTGQWLCDPCVSENSKKEPLRTPRTRRAVVDI